MKKLTWKKRMSVELHLRFSRRDTPDLDRLMTQVRKAISKFVPRLAQEFGGRWDAGGGIVTLKRDWMLATDSEDDRLGVRNAAVAQRRKKRGLSRRSAAEAG